MHYRAVVSSPSVTHLYGLLSFWPPANSARDEGPLFWLCIDPDWARIFLARTRTRPLPSAENSSVLIVITRRRASLEWAKLRPAPSAIHSIFIHRFRCRSSSSGDGQMSYSVYRAALAAAAVPLSPAPGTHIYNWPAVDSVLRRFDTLPPSPQSMFHSWTVVHRLATLLSILASLLTDQW